MEDLCLQNVSYKLKLILAFIYLSVEIVCLCFATRIYEKMGLVKFDYNVESRFVFNPNIFME